MEKKLLSLLAVVSLCSQAIFAQDNSAKPPRVCGQLYMQQETEKIANAAKQRNETDVVINDWIKKNENTPQATVIIPVVVHVLYTTAQMNADVSDAIIKSQIDILNKDYAANNADYSTIGTAFNSIKGNPNFQFCLATVDPKGSATTGITRTFTTDTSFEITTEEAKFTAKGGHDIWAPSHYLNIWVCPQIQYTIQGVGIQYPIQGYCQFPNQAGKDSTTDGAMIDYRAFGKTTKAYPYPFGFFSLGRTTTHEVGHWFNLHHIWGDASSPTCSDDDGVSDTPVQYGPDYGDFNTGDCPTAPTPSCSNGVNGDFWMDYMNYATDKCEVAFTKGQATVMQATVNTVRKSLLKSGACGSFTNVGSANSLAYNVSLYPNPTTGDLFANVEFVKSTDLLINVTNIMGQSVAQTQQNNTLGGNFKLDLSHQPNGVYLVELKSREESITRKIVLNR